LKLKEDILAAKPTVLPMVPRILNRYFEAFQSSIAGLGEPQRAFFYKVYEEKR